jgi:methylmalonyl-CoA/ethylmalonyl-CoA epimerase
MQHMAFLLPVSDFDRVIGKLREQDYTVIGEVDHPIARMAFFDTYHLLNWPITVMFIP